MATVQNKVAPVEVILVAANPVGAVEQGATNVVKKDEAEKALLAAEQTDCT